MKNCIKLKSSVFLRYLYVFMLFVFIVFILSASNAHAQSNAKNIILMIADGWGIKQIEATNDYTNSVPGYQTDPGWTQHWMSTFPVGGSYDTSQAWTNFNYVKQNAITDSAAAASALYTGSKTEVGNISVSAGDVDRLFAIGEKAKQLGKAAGAVSTVPASHATPGAWMSHNDVRANNYAIADEGFFEDPNTTGLSTDPLYGGGHGATAPSTDVIIGDGRSTYVNSTIRTKLINESGDPGKHTFVERATGVDGGDALLNIAGNASTTKLAGLFDHVYHLADGSGFNTENPTLADSTNAALEVLNRDPEGFVLMVEGGAVDWAGHANNMDQMIGELKDFNDAVQAVIDWVNDGTNGSDWNNTLVIITGDHETGYLTPDFNVFPDLPLGTVNPTTVGLEKIRSGSGGRRASWEDTNPNNGTIDAGETVYWTWNTGGHSNSLIPLYTRGFGSELFLNYDTGSDTIRGAYIDNTDVFNVMNGALDNLAPVANDDSAFTNIDTPSIIDVVFNDTDNDGNIDVSTVTIVDTPSDGLATPSIDGTVTYTPNAVFSGVDTFTYTVDDALGATSNVATVTVTVGSGSSSFFDDFSTDTTASYTLTDTSTIGGFGSFNYRGLVEQRVELITGDNVGLEFSHDVPALDIGTFSIDFLPTVKFPSGGAFELFLRQDATTYYLVKNTDGYGAKSIEKFVGNVQVDSQQFSNEYSQNTNYTITVNFSPGVTTVNAFGDILTINTDSSTILVSSCAVELKQQNGFFDNISYSGSGSSNLPPAAADDTSTTPLNTAVIINVVSNDTDVDGTIDVGTVTIISDVSNGTTVVNPNGTVLYTPDAAFVGPDTFTYTVDDNQGATSNIATVTVNAGNPPPVCE